MSSDAVLTLHELLRDVSTLANIVNTLDEAAYQQGSTPYDRMATLSSFIRKSKASTGFSARIAMEECTSNQSLQLDIPTLYSNPLPLSTSNLQTTPTGHATETSSYALDLGALSALLRSDTHGLNKRTLVDTEPSWDATVGGSPSDFESTVIPSPITPESVRALRPNIDLRWETYARGIASGPDAELAFTLAALKSDDVLQSLPAWVDRTRVTLCPGGLPLDVWYIILTAITRPLDLFACGLTCKVLAARVLKLQSDSRELSRVSGGLLYPRALREVLRHSPLVAHSLQRATVPAAALVRFIYECAGKLHALTWLGVLGRSDADDDGDSYALPPLPPPFFKAAARLKRVDMLQLHDIVFRSSDAFVRLVCALPALANLELTNVAWKDPPRYVLSGKPFARTLSLHNLWIYSSNPSQFTDFLLASRILQNGASLRLDMFKRIGPAPWTPDPRPSCELRTSEYAAHWGRPRLSAFPAPDASGALAFAVSVLMGACPLRDAPTYFGVVEALCAARAESVGAVHLSMQGTLEEVRTVMNEGPVPFAGLRARGVIKASCLDPKTGASSPIPLD
ncbi:hypothetical protein CERSUDRAFT_100605 [Gelatoporia subvermispora B]|uniref:Uncharacterized protein n=1 Tax=Ceriporiopsis subvermispora (strain B) TaxID=914234 RepID=M2QGU0_CERS8|nr:hypothetical protein CERSUDRAFT_100605 [Gelatoporia subvermispora B]